MDELEISGKRFISTRLAAKQHKYHADYIGQLIRGGKITGQKVGRSWYVDADSLAAYFSNPKSVEEAPRQILSVEPIKQKEAEPEVVEEIQKEMIMETPTPTPISTEVMQSFRRPLMTEDAVSEPVEREVEEKVFVEVDQDVARDSIHIPIRRAVSRKNPSLQYVDDFVPSLPEIQKVPNKRIKVSAAKHTNVQQGSLIAEDIQSGGLASRMLVPTFSIATLGLLAFAVVALSSLFINYTAVFEAGKAASVGYSLD